MTKHPKPVDVFNLDELKFSPTASLFEGLPRAGVGVTVLVVRTPPGTLVEQKAAAQPRCSPPLGSVGWSVG